MALRPVGSRALAPVGVAVPALGLVPAAACEADALGLLPFARARSPSAAFAALRRCRKERARHLRELRHRRR